jgi:hypothetical protein
MKYVSLIAALVLPTALSAQTTHTNCYSYTPQSIDCTTTQPYQPQRRSYVNPNAFSDAFDRGMQMSQQRRAAQQQAELAAQQQQNIELQNELLRQQIEQQREQRVQQSAQPSREVLAEAAVIRMASWQFVEAQRQLPDEQRTRDALQAGLQIAAIARRHLGYEPTAEAIELADQQMKLEIEAFERAQATQKTEK